LIKNIVLGLFILLFSTSSFAVSEDTKLIIEFIKSETKANRDLIIANQKVIDKRFEQVDKRFEQIDKRFEQVDKRIEQVDKRIDDLRESTNKQLAQVDKKIDNQFYLIISGFVLILGYLLKERTVISHNLKLA
jgi:septal ring factor EnvC (AmiA/AmiB activator)